MHFPVSNKYLIDPRSSCGASIDLGILPTCRETDPVPHSSFRALGRMWDWFNQNQVPLSGSVSKSQKNQVQACFES